MYLNVDLEKYKYIGATEVSKLDACAIPLKLHGRSLVWVAHQVVEVRGWCERGHPSASKLYPGPAQVQ